VGDHLLAVQLPRILELTDNQRVGILEKHPIIIAHLSRKTAVPAHRLEHRQIVCFGNLIVIRAKSRSDMHNTGTIFS